jgi:hypothetical protein
LHGLKTRINIYRGSTRRNADQADKFKLGSSS